MTTQTALKAEIADDLDSTIWTNAIASEITAAIRHYQPHRFYFNESRDETFATVADQVWYSSSDDAAIPNFMKIDGIWITDNATNYPLVRIDPKEFETLTDSSAADGRPFSYTWYNQQIGLYPIADAAYTVRILGHLLVAAPASDGEADNVWMTEAYELIRFRAERRLYAHKLHDTNSASIAGSDERDEYSRLKGETNIKTGTGLLQPTQF